MSRKQALKELSSRSPSEPAGAWLERILAAVPADGGADAELIDELLRGINGPLADEQRRIEEDPQAYLRFWRTLAERLPSQPLARAAYADTLLLTGDTESAVEQMLAAFEADPLLIYRMSGEYRDVIERAGPREWAIYRALTVKAAELDDPDGNREYVREELEGLLDEVGDDPELRRAVLGILGP